MACSYPNAYFLMMYKKEKMRMASKTVTEYPMFVWVDAEQKIVSFRKQMGYQAVTIPSHERFCLFLWDMAEAEYRFM